MSRTSSRSGIEPFPVLIVKEDQLPVFFYIIGTKKCRVLYCALASNNGVRVEKCGKDFKQKFDVSIVGKVGNTVLAGT